MRESLKTPTWFEEICICMYGVVFTWHLNLEKYIGTHDSKLDSNFILKLVWSSHESRHMSHN